VPSTYLLVGLIGVELGDHQRFTIKWSCLTSLVLLAVGLLTAVIPVRGSTQIQIPGQVPAPIVRVR
jgi:CitMHS family citrate-Mg2+:H+ or citrate-Ca2+:H+ symporter